MKIPRDPVDRIIFYNRLIQQCFTSREQRKNFYSAMRMMYLFGSEAGQLKDGDINKIYPAVDLLASFLYAQETTRFAIQFGQGADRVNIARASTINDVMNDEWMNTDTDFIANEAVKWALVYNTMIIKVVVRAPEVHPTLILPHNFGVLREDMPGLDSQEAVCVQYQITKSDLATQLEGHPRAAEILEKAVANAASDYSEFKSPVERLLISAGPGTGSPNIVGEVDNPVLYTFQYEPKVDADMVRMYELYVYDDEIKDWQIVTTAYPGVVVFDRPSKQVFLEHELSFVKMTPNPLPDYFWGRSEVEALAGLQKRRQWLSGMLQNLLALNAKPPKALMGDGWTGIVDEKHAALDEPNSFIANDNPNANVKEFRPEIPPDLWKEFGYNDEQFLEEMGLSNILMGRGEHGVRSQQQTKSLATLGSSRSKKRALVVEDSLEKLATLYLKLKRKYDPKAYTDDKGNKFVMAQVEDDFVVKVDAHSNSPLFMEDQRQMAADLLQAKAINRRSYIKLLNPPMQANLIHELETEIEPSEAKAQKEAQLVELTKEAAQKPEGAGIIKDLIAKLFGGKGG